MPSQDFPQESSPSTPAATLTMVGVDDLGTPLNPGDLYRNTLKDAQSDYRSIDLVIELLQNAVDSIDQRRFELICAAAKKDPSNISTITLWNQTVETLLQEDFNEYTSARGSGTADLDVAALYKKWAKDPERRRRWWSELAKNFGCEAGALEKSVAADVYGPKIVVRYSHDQKWIQIEDNGVGMDLSAKTKLLAYFRHTGSEKRPSPGKPKRLGTRGHHGWGLTAVLAYTDELTICSKSDTGPLAGWCFKGFRTFAAGGNAPTTEMLPNPELQALVTGALVDAGAQGTAIRVSLMQLDESNALTYVLRHYNAKRFITFLRTMTPLGQVNDYVMHPAYHCYRKSDGVLVAFVDEDTQQIVPFPYAFLELREYAAPLCVTQDVYQNRPTAMRGKSVHTVHRKLNSFGLHILTAAEIQDHKTIADIAKKPLTDQELVADSGADGDEGIRRGFYLAHSGGMIASCETLDTTGNRGMFRGITLADGLEPTLARRHIPDDRKDGRRSVPLAAKDHVAKYEELRKNVRTERFGSAVLAHAKNRSELFEGTLKEFADAPLPIEDWHVWAGEESGEARVMLLFAELLHGNVFGDLRVLSCGLKDRYDFEFVYRSEKTDATTIPNSAVLARLSTDKVVKITNLTKGTCYRLGVGEFKAKGHAVFDNFDPKDPTKSAEILDLLVCWEFDKDEVSKHQWDVSDVTDDAEREFPNQTHMWEAQPTSPFGRSRPLAVIALGELRKRFIDGAKVKVEDPRPKYEIYWT